MSHYPKKTSYHSPSTSAAFPSFFQLPRLFSVIREFLYIAILLNFRFWNSPKKCETINATRRPCLRDWFKVQKPNHLWTSKLTYWSSQHVYWKSFRENSLDKIFNSITCQNWEKCLCQFSSNLVRKLSVELCDFYNKFEGLFARSLGQENTFYLQELPN